MISQEILWTKKHGITKRRSELIQGSQIVIMHILKKLQWWVSVPQGDSAWTWISQAKVQDLSLLSLHVNNENN